MVNSKALIVGDGAIGKTCLLSRITNNAIEWEDGDVEYEPTTFNNFNLTWDTETEEGDSKTLDLELWDTAGQEGFEQLRTLSYPGTDVYLVGYACNSAISLRNISSKWMEEIKRCREENEEAGEPWVILVGTKKDIRSDVTEEMAADMAKTINACALVDTSAKLPDKATNGVEELENLMMSLAFMKADGEDRPNWEGAAKEAAPVKKTGSDKPVDAVAVDVAEKHGKPEAKEAAHVAQTPKSSSGKKKGKEENKTQDADQGCKCVIS